MESLLAAADVAGTTDRAVLIATLGGIVVTTITGIFAVLTNRKRNDNEPPPAALVDMYGDAVEQWMKRVIVCERESAAHQATSDMWEQRARDLGWAEP